MTSLFSKYRLVKESGLFDEAYYCDAYPEIRAAHLDPLLHYLETGAAELRNPSKAFDARYYVGLCRKRGEQIDNPLVHYLEVGAAQGLEPYPSKTGAKERTRKNNSLKTSKSDSPQILLALDRVEVELRQRGACLTGVGWCLGTSPIAELEVKLGSLRVHARYGLERADVASRFPHTPNAGKSGFEFLLEPLPAQVDGVGELILKSRTLTGQETSRSFEIDLPALHAARKARSAAKQPASDSTSAGRAIDLYVDSVGVDDAGILHVLGWAVCLEPIVAVMVLLDGEKIGLADYGQARDDVAETHAQYPNARYSGFALHADTRTFTAGDREIKVRALTAAGTSREVAWPVKIERARRSRARRTERPKLDYYCDFAQVTVGGQITVAGWILGAAATEQIVVLLDGQELGEAETAIERSDVGIRFPGVSHALRSGFAFRHQLSSVAPGEHSITLRHRADGQRADIVLSVVAAPAAEATAPADSVFSPRQEDLQFNVDLPRVVDGKVVEPVRGNLEIVGWALARTGAATLEIELDGNRLKSVSTGIRRIDVQRAFPSWEGALTAGFSALVPHHSLPKGPHVVAVSLRDQKGQVARSEFRIDVEDAPDVEGPWALRTRMTAAEVNTLSQPFATRHERPTFTVVLSAPSNARAKEQVRATVASLAAQVYESWRLRIIGDAREMRALQSHLVKGFGGLADRIKYIDAKLARDPLEADDPAPSHFMILCAGDELGCDALLEFAACAALQPEADFLYCDERRVSAASGKMEAFFKPQWSPDLLLGANYLGRAWCVRADLLKRARLRPSDLARTGSYDLVLRLTEYAAKIWHIPALLLQQGAGYAEKPVEERKALQSALARRGINAEVKPGRTKSAFRVQRKLAAQQLVSIIIPTCAARGLIRICIETLRKLTAYRNFEIVCIENIPALKQDWKAWVRANADVVLETHEPFNWSRYNNLAAAAAHGQFLLFLNDDIEVIDGTWLDALLEHAQRPEIGAVGAQLLYPDRRVQHAGMFLANRGIARHAFRGAAGDDPGYFGLALTERNVSAVTGACLMTRRDTFEALGGFDERHEVVNNDVDFCLAVGQRGLRTIYTPHATLVHHELASRSDLADSYDAAAFESKWRSIFVTGDPFFHPRLTKERDDYSIEWEPTELHCAGNPILLRESIRRILALKLDHIGDCVTALPAIRRLKRHFPAASIAVLTAASSRSIWELEPAVDKVIEFDYFHARSALGLVEHTDEDWQALREQLSSEHFDLAIDLRKHWETRPLLRHTGARYLAGFDMKGKFAWLDVALEWSEDSALLPKRSHAADDLVNLVDAVAFAAEPDRAVIARAPSALPSDALGRLPEARRIFQKRVICVHPCAGNEMRQWPEEYFGLLIDELIKSEDVYVVLIGGPDEVELGTRILSATAYPKSIWSLIGRIGLSNLPALIARCALFVGNNSGPQHIAAGLGIPTVGIHSGVVDAREWGPKGLHAVALQRAMICAPCYLSKREDCNRELACLRGMLPADVLRVCRRLLATAASGKVPLEHAAGQLINKHPR